MQEDKDHNKDTINTKHEKYFRPDLSNREEADIVPEETESTASERKDATNTMLQMSELNDYV